MIAALPFRARLLVWYTAVIAGSLLVFAALVWFGLRGSLMAASQTALQEHLKAAERSIPEDPKEAPTPQQIREDAGEFAQTLPSDTKLEIFDAEGGLLFSSGPFSAEAVRAGFIEQNSARSIGGRGWRFHLAATLLPMQQMLLQLGVTLACAIPAALLLATLGGYWMMRRALEPVRTMAEAARSLDPVDLTRRVRVPMPRDEFRELAEMWNGMLQRIEASMLRVRSFTADASHELRTPLAAMQITAEVALRRPRQEEEYRRALEKIVVQAGRATRLVADLLTLARTDAGRAVRHVESVELQALLEPACQAFAPLAQSKGIVLETRFPLDAVLVEGDADALQRVTAILIDNALKYTAAGTIAVRLEPRTDAVALSIEDTGCGISASDLPHVFERFYRADKSRSTPGTGLGLAIAKSIVESHGGSITAESEPPGFTRFTVLLPLSTVRTPVAQLSL